MKKISFVILILTIVSCDTTQDNNTPDSIASNEKTYIINESIEYVSNENHHSTTEKFVYDTLFLPEINKNIITKNSAQTVNINFNYGIGGYTNSGCTVQRLNSSGNGWYTQGVYGPNPVLYDGYSIRGFGSPHHNLYYNSLILMASNKGKKVPYRGTIINDNLQKGSAITIEYPFKANVSYEISLQTVFHDNRYLIDKVHSSGFPTIYVQLQDNGNLPFVVRKADNCTTINKSEFLLYNFDYVRTATLDSPAIMLRIYTFKFSPINMKKGVLISLQPAIGQRGVDSKIPTNNYTMALPLVSITEQPFDPSINTTPTNGPRSPGRR